MKSSEAFEGPNSSLRQAFDEATKDTPQSNIDWREDVTNQASDWLFETDEYVGVNVTLVKQFISQLLEAEKKRWREEVI